MNLSSQTGPEFGTWSGHLRVISTLFIPLYSDHGKRCRQSALASRIFCAMSSLLHFSFILPMTLQTHSINRADCTLFFGLLDSLTWCMNSYTVHVFLKGCPDRKISFTHFTVHVLWLHKQNCMMLSIKKPILANSCCTTVSESSFPILSVGKHCNIWFHCVISFR